MSTEVRKPQVAVGLVNLSSQEGPLFKKSLLCYSGTFKGMWGPVDVSVERLQAICDRYNKLRAKPINQNDFVPVLKNHDRNVDNVLGRLMADLTVEDWVNPETGTETKALFGSLRIDDEIAKKFVESGKYAQLSISFDEETEDLLEVSFVAVEAARRSQVLSKGDTNMSVELKALESKVTELSRRNDTVLSAVKLAKSTRKVTCLAMSTELASATNVFKDLTAGVTTLMLKFKTAALGAEFKGFVTAGKMTKAEYDGIKVSELAALPSDALKPLLSSYANRAVSTDIVQHGQAGAQPVDLSTMTPEQTREAIKLQREGKSAPALAGGDPAPAERKPGEEPAKPAADVNGASMKLGDIDEAMEHAKGLGSMVEKACGYMNSMGSALKKLMEEDEKKDPSEE